MLAGGRDVQCQARNCRVGSGAKHEYHVDHNAAAAHAAHAAHGDGREDRPTLLMQANRALFTLEGGAQVRFELNDVKGSGVALECEEGTDRYRRRR